MKHVDFGNNGAEEKDGASHSKHVKRKPTDAFIYCPDFSFSIFISSLLSAGYVKRRRFTEVSISHADHG